MTNPTPILHWLANGMSSFGLNLDKMPLSDMERHWLTSTTDTHRKPSFDDYLAIFDKVASASGETEIGLRLSEHIDDHELGLLGYILLNVESIGDFLRLASRYHMTMGNFTSTKLHLGKNNSRFSYEVLVPVHRSAKHDIALTLSRRIRFIREHLNSDWQPERTCFSFDSPDDIDLYRQRFGDNILFNQAVDFFEVSNDCLNVAVNDSDPNLLNIITEQADEVLTRARARNDVVDAVKMQLTDRIGRRNASQEKIAQALNVSRATLQRRLEAKGTSFRKLRDEVIYQLSTSELTDTDATIGEIAMKMGYSELSSFDRGFSRLSGGITPREFRRKFRSTDTA